MSGVNKGARYHLIVRGDHILERKELCHDAHNSSVELSINTVIDLKPRKISSSCSIFCETVALPPKMTHWASMKQGFFSSDHPDNAQYVMPPNVYWPSAEA